MGEGSAPASLTRTLPARVTHPTASSTRLPRQPLGREAALGREGGAVERTRARRKMRARERRGGRRARRRLWPPLSPLSSLFPIPLTHAPGGARAGRPHAHARAGRRGQGEHDGFAAVCVSGRAGVCSHQQKTWRGGDHTGERAGGCVSTTFVQFRVTPLPLSSPIVADPLPRRRRPRCRPAQPSRRRPPPAAPATNPSTRPPPTRSCWRW